MQVLSFRSVSKCYDAFETALKEVSFDVGSGEFTALAGPSGSGKTTILNLAAGLDKPTSGRVALLECNLGELSSEQMFELRRSSVGFVFQAYNLFPVLTALENVEYVLAIGNNSQKGRRKRAIKALRAVEMAEFAGRFPAELSGGQQQRVAIARAIVTEPRIVFADEPTANLDSKTGFRLLELFQRLNQEKGITFLFSSHDPIVLSVARRILFVTDGIISKAEEKTVTWETTA